MIVPLPLKPLKTRGQFFFLQYWDPLHRDPVPHHTGIPHLHPSPGTSPPPLLRTWKAFFLVQTSFPIFFCPYEIKFALTVQPVQNSFIMPKLKLLIKMKVNRKTNASCQEVGRFWESEDSIAHRQQNMEVRGSTQALKSRVDVTQRPE